MQSAIQSFIIRQYNQISVEGWPALWHKLQRFVLLFLVPLFILLAIHLVLLIRLIRPLIIVRIGVADVGRIGGIYPVDWYLSEKADGHHQSQNLDRFYVWN